MKIFLGSVYTACGLTDCTFELGVSASESSESASRVRAEVPPWLVLRKPSPEPVVWLLSHVWIFEILWTAARQASLTFTISLSLLKSMFIELVMPSTHLILCCPLLLLSVFPSIRVFSSESALSIRCPKYWCFSSIISPSNEYSGLILFRIDCFALSFLLEIYTRHCS